MIELQSCNYEVISFLKTLILTLITRQQALPLEKVMNIINYSDAKCHKTLPILS